MRVRFLQWLGLSCQHDRTTFPQTAQGNTYVVCLECGKKFPYDWERMRVVLASDTEPRVTARIVS